MNSAFDICLNLPYLLKSVKILLLPSVDWDPCGWAADLCRQILCLSTQMDALLSIHRDFCATVVDMAQADLMLYEGQKGIFGKTQPVHLELEWIRIFCVCLLCMTASEKSCSLPNSSSVNGGCCCCTEDGEKNDIREIGSRRKWPFINELNLSFLTWFAIEEWYDCSIGQPPTRVIGWTV